MWNDTGSVLISPSIIAADLATFGHDVAKLDPGVVDFLHIDVMDGCFVPNLTFGPGYIKNLISHTNIPLDVHLMIASPESSLSRYIELTPKIITIHYESTRFPIRILDQIRSSGTMAGLSFNPATPISNVVDLLPYLDMVLLMSVDPGFYGQKFLEISMRRIMELRELISKAGLSENVMIQVDGGITQENIAAVVRAGARIVVAGNAAFHNGAVNENVSKLKESALKGLR